MQEQTEQEQFDSIEAEMQVLNMLLKTGAPFGVPKKSILKYFSKNKTRVFYLKRLYLGTMDYLSNEQIKMYLDEIKLKDDPFHEKNIVVTKNSKLAARVIAIAVLNSYWRILLFSRLLASYFYWRLDSVTLFEVSKVVGAMYDSGNFINSIRLMHGIRRTSQKTPEPIAEADRIEVK